MKKKRPFAKYVWLIWLSVLVLFLTLLFTNNSVDTKARIIADKIIELLIRDKRAWYVIFFVLFAVTAAIGNSRDFPRRLHVPDIILKKKVKAKSPFNQEDHTPTRSEVLKQWNEERAKHSKDR